MVSLISSEVDLFYFGQAKGHLQELTDFTEEINTLTPSNCKHTMRAWEYWSALHMIKFEPTDDVIDIGAQPSFVDAWIAKRVRSVLAIDSKQFEGWGPHAISPVYAEWSKLLTALAPNIQTKIADGRATGLSDESLDVVISFSVLEHLEPGQDSLVSKEAHRILKPGGLFAGTVDYGRPKDGVPFVELYDNEAFKDRIVNAVGWKWVAEAPDHVLEPKARSTMAFVLQKII